MTEKPVNIDPNSEKCCNLYLEKIYAHKLINEQIGDGSYREFPALGYNLLEETIKKCRERACPFIEECENSFKLIK